VVWSWTGWIALALAVWLVVGVLVGLLIGRVIRHRDRQVPHDGQAGVEQGDDTGARARTPDEPDGAPPTGAARRSPRRARRE
jgi:hypothetical protein